MNEILGANNSWLDYVLVLLIYGIFFLFIRYPKPTLELNYRSNYLFLVAIWAFLMFTGNFLFYKLGVMSFLPWLNNLLHSFVWVGICLGWLYYSTHERPLWEQFIFFAFTSFVIKMAENLLLGTWHREAYLGVDNRYAYLIAMSLVDGFYPVISRWLLNWFGKHQWFGVYIPKVA